MLQKPKTKFGYARRIFALPVLFSVAFAYMVNAKNKEIKETNIAIKEAVSQIKRDTITPQQTEKREIISPKFFKESSSKKEIAELGKKIEEKSKALKNLKPESKEFQQKVDEIGELSGEIGRITNSDDFKMAFIIPGTESKRINDFFKSDEWKNRTKALEDLGVEMPDLSDLDIDFPDVPVPPSAPNAPRVRVMKFQNWDSGDTKISRKAIRERKAASKRAEKARIEAMKLSEKAREMGEKARIEGMKAGEMGRIQGEAVRIAGEQIRIAGERARLEGEKARKAGEKVRLEALKRISEGAKGNVYFYKSTNTDKPGSVNRTMELEADYIKKDANGMIAMNGVKKFRVNGLDDTKIFLDGREITKSEMDAIKPENIASITINKENGANIRRGEIRIQTKK
jgi:hypothetical protein